MKFSNNQVAKIHGTQSSLDDQVVYGTGISMYEGATGQAFYVIEKVDGELFQTQHGEWKSLILTQHCLSPV